MDSEINIHKIGTTLIAWRKIEVSEGQNRREQECAAVRAIIDQMMGVGCELSHTADGAPRIQGANISISHSRDLAVVAFDSMREIGVDAEEWRPTLQRVRTRFLSESECQWCITQEQILAAWTIKEAVYKLVGREAVDFRASIQIHPDMKSACVGDRYIKVQSLDTGRTHISLAFCNLR